MALLKYFKKVSQDDISVASTDSKLKAAEENAVKQQLFLDAPGQRKGGANMEHMMLFNEQKLQNGELRME